MAARVAPSARTSCAHASRAPPRLGGVWFPQDAHLDPARLVRALAERASARGARLATGHEVLGFERTGRRIARIVSTRGDFSADQVVLAAGAFSPALAAQLDLRVPVQAAKGYSVTVAASAGLREPARPVSRRRS
jgi:D-amino-acid dehydrogenase